MNNKWMVSALVLALSSIGVASVAYGDEYQGGGNAAQVRVETKYDFGFDFAVLSGSKIFTPIQAFTDGKRTWVQFRDTGRTPLSFADGQPVSGKVEGMFYIIDGVYSSVNFIDAKTNTNIVMVYDGVYQMKKPATLYSSGAPMAINGVAQMPIEQAKPVVAAPPTFTVATQKAAPVSAIQKPSGMAGFFSVAKVAPSRNEVGCAVKTDPNVASGINYIVDNSFFIPTNDKNAEVTFEKDVVDALRIAVTSGKRIKITGVAGTKTEVGRVGRANLRAINAKLELNAYGINDESIEVKKHTNYPVQDTRSGVEFKILKAGA